MRFTDKIVYKETSHGDKIILEGKLTISVSCTVDKSAKDDKDLLENIKSMQNKAIHSHIYRELYGHISKAIYILNNIEYSASKGEVEKILHKICKIVEE